VAVVGRVRHPQIPRMAVARTGPYGPPVARGMSSHATRPVRAPIYDHVLCGIDGSPWALEAAAQAAALTSVGGQLEMMAVSDATLRNARRVAATISEDIEVCTTQPAAPASTPALVAAASAYDVLVVPSHAGTEAVHESHTPVLVARRPPADIPFPQRIVVGAGGPGDPEAAIAAGTRIAEAANGRTVELAVTGEARRKLVAAAWEERASLMIVGSRGLTGLGGVDSTSEYIAREAPCSVLVLRH
jgi:nucleotide-binding universal stress UspA family protein